MPKLKSSKLAKEPMTKATTKKSTKTKATSTVPVSVTPNTMAAIDIFVYPTSTTVVDPNERPDNVLDRQPGEHDAKSIETLVNEFTDGPAGKLTQKQVKNKQVSYKSLPKFEKIPLRNLMSALAVQRPASHKHLKNILVGYDEKKVQYVNVLKIKVGKKYVYYVIDGQHTAITYGVWAKWGYFLPEVQPENWLDVEIMCQVVEHSNFTFAREHFLGINGEDKLKLAYFDKWKNYVLSKRQDSPDDICANDKYEDAYAQQIIMESYGIIPIHEKDEINEDKPGAFKRVDLLKDLSEEEMHWWCGAHQLNWDDRSVDSVEVAPMVNLRHKLKGAKSLSNPQVKEFVITLGNIVKNVVGSPAKLRTLTDEAYKEWFRNSYPGEKIPTTYPPDAPLALLLYMYYEHGGTFNNLSKMFLDDFSEQGYTIFHALDQNIQDLIKP
jgi:hypothetical protein